MILARRDPFAHFFGEVNRIQDEFTRLFGNGPVHAGPPMNLWADDEAFHVETDLPGIDPDTLDINVTDGTQLTIRGERKPMEPESATWLRQERPSGTFTRSLTLPSLVDVDKVDARYEHGVLKLTLPKSEAAKPRKITVKS